MSTSKAKTANETGPLDFIINAVLVASKELRELDLRNKTSELFGRLQSPVKSIVDELRLSEQQVMWVNAYIDMERDRRFSAEIVDLAETLYGIVPVQANPADVQTLHKTIFERITVQPEVGLTNLLKRKKVPEESILKFDKTLVLEDAQGNALQQVGLEHVQWYAPELTKFAEGYQYAHIKHPHLVEMHGTLAVNCCGAYIMCKDWAAIRSLVYPTLRAFILELGARVAHWLVEELALEHRRQSEMANMVHRRAADATRAFGDATRSLNMLRDLVAPEISVFFGPEKSQKFASSAKSVGD